MGMLDFGARMWPSSARGGPTMLGFMINAQMQLNTGKERRRPRRRRLFARFGHDCHAKDGSTKNQRLRLGQCRRRSGPGVVAESNAQDHSDLIRKMQAGDTPLNSIQLVTGTDRPGLRLAGMGAGGLNSAVAEPSSRYGLRSKPVETHFRILFTSGPITRLGQAGQTALAVSRPIRSRLGRASAIP